MRAKVHTEEIRKDREALIVTAIPYQVNKRVLIEKIAEQVREKRIEGISDIWDESNREGMRVVIELKRDAIADVVLNQLWRFSDLQTSFGANMLAINGGRPEQLNLKDFIASFTAFREEVVLAAHQAPAGQVARPRARVGRPRRCRRQHRRHDQADPQRAEPGGSARADDGARLAGQGHRPAGRADRRSAPQADRRPAPSACPTSRPAPFSTCACSA